MKQTKAISILGAAAAAAFATSASAAPAKQITLSSGVTQVDWANGYQDLHNPGGPGWLGKGYSPPHRHHR